MNNTRNFLIEAFGWYGTTALIGAYALLSFGVISSDGLAYQILNVTGALGIVSVSLHKKNYQPAVLNVIWTVIGLVALASLVF